MKIICLILFFAQPLLCYELPAVNLGYTSFLDGGPIESAPGWYWQQYFQYYNTPDYFNTSEQYWPCSNRIKYNEFLTLFQLYYEFGKSIPFLNARPGFLFQVPVTFHAKFSKNTCEIRAGGSGWSDITLGLYFQWQPVMYNGRPLIINRVEFDITFPTGYYKKNAFLSPSDNLIVINPYWAASLFITEKLVADWRIHYLWCSQRSSDRIQPGQAFHANHSVGYYVTPRLFAGINGYWLWQFTNDRWYAKEILHSRERVIALGPGALYALVKNYDVIIFANLYFEAYTRNRPQGTRAFVRLLVHF